MKIGILTHPLRFNYGGILQNYALQQVLLKQGHDVYTIDWNDDKSLSYRLLSYLKRLYMHYILGCKEIQTDFHIHLTRNQFLKKNSKNQEFINKNIRCTKYISSKQGLSQINKMGFDMIVVGSDQVWQKQFVPTMFLDFLDSHIKRISYAASFGKSEWIYNIDETNIAKELIKLFKAISVREESAIELCKEHLNAKAEWVLDPTMLLSKFDYEKAICSFPDYSPKEPYIMTYILDKNECKRQIQNMVEATTNLKNYKVETIDSSISNTHNTVYSWVYGIKNSKLVLTDSFHGVVFSIIFNKPFIAIGNYKRGMDRFTSLLNKLHLSHLLITSANDICKVIEDSFSINYGEVNSILEAEKKRSLSFITQSINDL